MQIDLDSKTDLLKYQESKLAEIDDVQKYAAELNEELSKKDAELEEQKEANEKLKYPGDRNCCPLKILVFYEKSEEGCNYYGTFYECFIKSFEKCSLHFSRFKNTYVQSYLIYHKTEKVFWRLITSPI